MDPSWCPGCDRLILPKRILVPVTTSVSDNQPSQQQSPPPPPPPPASTPVPSSPQVRKKQRQQPRRLGLGGGLVHGTGLVRPGAPLKSSSNSSKEKVPPARRTQQQQQQQQPQQPQKQQQPRKSRVVISQDPTPLYCSEECRVRDLKNSFIESESAGFAGAPAALKHIAKLEHIEQLEKRFQNQKKLTRRHSSNTSPTLSHASTDSTATSTSASTTGVASTSSHPSTSLVSTPPPTPASQPTTPSTADARPKLKPIFRTSSYSSTSTTASNPNNTIANKDRTIRPAFRRNSSTSVLLSRVPSWGSPSKAALAPPTTNLFHACSSSGSLDSITNTSVSMSSLFEGSYTRRSVDTEGTTPSGSGSGSGSDEKRKGKRVSFAGDSKPCIVESPEEEKIASTSTSATQIATRDEKPTSSNVDKLDDTAVNEDWRLLSKNRRRNPLQDAHPLLEALSLSPKDRRVRPSSLPTAGTAAAAATGTGAVATSTATNPTQPHPHPALPHALTASHSTPAIVPSTSSLRRSATAASTIYKVAMWPEDEKRTTESAQVHGDLLRGYAKRFGPREGRSLVWSPLWVSADRASSSASASASSSSTSPHRRHPTSPTSPSWPAVPPTTISTATTATPDHDHDSHPDSDKTYWVQWESQQAALRARRKAESEVARLEEERVISELLDGAGMKEEDQPQARRMRRMAYDGMPGPAELRGLTYSFDKFLYDLGEFTGGAGAGEAQEQERRASPVQEKKRLFNFED